MQGRTWIVGLTGGIGTGKSRVAGLLRELGAAVECADQIVRELQTPGAAGLAAIAATFGPEVLLPSGELDRARLGDLVFRDAEARRTLGRLIHPLVQAELARRVDAHARAGVAVLVVDIPLLLEASAARSEAQPSEVGSAARSEAQPSEVGSAARSEAQPSEVGSAARSEAQPSEVGSAARSEAQPSEVGSAARSEAQPSEVGRRAGSRSGSALPFDVIALVYAAESTQIERVMARDGLAREDAERRVRAQLSIEAKRALADVVIDNDGDWSRTAAQVRELHARWQSSLR